MRIENTLVDHCTAFGSDGLRVRMNRVIPGEPVLRHAHPKAHATAFTGHMILKTDEGDREIEAPEGFLAVFVVPAGIAHALHAIKPSSYACIGEIGFDE